MKEVSKMYVPIGKRTRLQRSMKEKELSERIRRARLAARSKHRKMNDEINDQKLGVEGGDVDESDDEDIKIVDEAEYLKRKSNSEAKEASFVPLGFEGDSDDSVQLVGERWNPLGVGIVDDEDEEGVDGASGSGSLPIPESDSDLFTASEEDEYDDELTDEDFRVDEDDSGTNFSSDSSSEEDDEYRKKSGNDANNHVRRFDNRLKKMLKSTFDEEIQSRDVDESYMQWISKNYECSSDNQDELHKNSNVELKSEPKCDPEPEDSGCSEDGGSSKRDRTLKNRNVVRESETENKPLNFGSSVNDGNRNGDRPPKNRNVVIKLDSENDPRPVNFGNCKTNTFIPSPPSRHSRSFENGADREGDSLAENRNMGIEFEPEKFGNSDHLGKRSIDMLNYENGSGRERDCLPENMNMGIKSEPENFGSPDIDSKRKRGRPSLENVGDRERDRLPENMNMGIEFEPENFGSPDNDVKRKRGRPRKNSNVEMKSTLPRKKPPRRLKSNEVENIMLNTILENRNAGLDSCISSVAVSEGSTTLPLKFKYEVGNSLPVSSEEMHDSERLFQDLKFYLRTCDIGAQTSFMDENDDVHKDDVHPCDSVVLQEKMCREGKHYIILDDEIGFRCKYCSFVKLEIRYVTPEFKKNIFGRTDNRSCGLFPYDNAHGSDGFHLPEFNGDPQSAQSNSIEGTVWELIPGKKESLYPHQREGFEFIWRNIEGGIKLDEVGKPTKFGTGGCIICHAPGTGKTRLAITFLQSFIRLYPMSKPVIIAPRSMLLTWEEEFTRWDIGVLFINMNKAELSGNEDPEVLKYAENVRHPKKTIRTAKLYTWAKGHGILGISYTLFEQLAGDRKGVDMRIRQILLEQPGILVLDEGHTPRNDQSNIWNVLTEVETRRRIILSGTPFQNNFEELLNTLSLVREEFGNPLTPVKFKKSGWKNNPTERRGLMDCNADNDRRIVKLKNQMKPFVHVHKGEILKKTLRGLFHSVLFLKPSDLQKTCLQQLNGMKNGLKLDHLVSIASVHPSLLHSCEQIPPLLKAELKVHRKNLDAGVKIRFLFDLINMAEGEKVLIFSQFLVPLKFLRHLLKSAYNWAEERELLYMDGKQDAKQRQAFIRHFNDPKSEARVLLASTKACNEGIHLVGASRVVLLDVVWNPSVERQAISRAYRLGQPRDVYVYHLITSGTQEEDKYYWQMSKDRVSEKVFSSEEEISQNVRTLPKVSEDRILEEMIQHEKIKSMFAKIIYQPKTDEFIESFGPANL